MQSTEKNQKILRPTDRKKYCRQSQPDFNHNTQTDHEVQTILSLAYLQSSQDMTNSTSSDSRQKLKSHWAVLRFQGMVGHLLSPPDWIGLAGGRVWMQIHHCPKEAWGLRETLVFGKHIPGRSNASLEVCALRMIVIDHLLDSRLILSRLLAYSKLTRKFFLESS